MHNNKRGSKQTISSTHYKPYNLNYTIGDFISCANNGEINWLYYRNTNTSFVINKKGFEKEVSQIVGENMDYISILNEINIPTDNISSKTIHTNRGNTRGFEITFEELSKNLFGMYIPVYDNTKENT